MADEPGHDPGCWNCDGPLETTVRVLDGVTWTTRRCPACGAMFTMADAGDIDLGLIRDSTLNRHDPHGLITDG